MRKSFQSICEEPVGADEQMLAGWEEALEECGMGMHREPRRVSIRRTLDYSSIAESNEFAAEDNGGM